MKEELPHVSVPLHEIAHPLIATTANLFAGERLPGSARLFKSVRDQDWYETSHGERWRGLVRWHPTEQCWLCVAGWHEQASAQDVFRRFTADCTTPSGIDSSKYLPKGADHKRLQGEQEFQRRQQGQLAFRVIVVTVLLTAVADTNNEQTATLPDGTGLRVQVTTDADDEFDELRLRFAIKWAGGKGLRQMDDVQRAVPGVALDEWDFIPPGPSGEDPGCFVYVDSDWIARLIDAAAEHGVDTLGSAPNLALVPADGLAHVGISRSITAAYAEGLVVRAFCGRRFIPSADPENADDCPRCMLVAGLIQKARQK